MIKSNGDIIIMGSQMSLQGWPVAPCAIACMAWCNAYA